MNTTRIFAVEFFIAVGINSWGALKQGYAPWPPVIVTSAIAMAILSMTSAIDDRLAVLLGTGFLIACLVTNLTSGGKFSDTFGALPQNVSYDVLKLNSAGTANSAGGTNTPGSQANG
jgi:hypothetical protein